MGEVLKVGTKWLGIDVLTAAKQRIRHVINTFDYLEVAFSGGKDSLVVIHLVREVYDELGITEPVNILFRDEELIPDNVIEFVQKYNYDTRFKLRYFAVPLANQRFILGSSRPYVQWDINRKWMREKPDFAIKSFGEEWDNNPGIQQDVDRLSFVGIKGRIALLNGVRAEESLTRFRASINKRHENYINATEAKNVKFCKVIFDWTEKDVFRYFYDRKIPYAPIYDHQMFAGAPMRVSTPVHSQSYRYQRKLPEMYPQFYSQLIDIWPDIHAHTKYWKDLNLFKVIDKYPHTWDGIYQYIEDHLDEQNKPLAIKTVKLVQSNREKAQKEGRGSFNNLWAFPILYVFKTIVSATYLKGIQPKATPASPKEFAFEGFT
jgi:3'-phosphoadenosine 5'-phosphosulfate sulfotransferase (PAPS reductase)/FAD synthetase